MKKLTLILSMSLLMTACGKKPKETETADATTTAETQAPEIKPEETQATTEVVAEKPTEETDDAEPKEPTYNIGGEFDWSKIPVSTANIGSFPYVSAPDGMYIYNGEGKPYTKFWDFNKLIMFDGTNVFDAEGKRALLVIEHDGDFNEYKFDKSVEGYLKSIGAVEIFNGELPKPVADYINEGNNNDFIITFGLGQQRMYALNHTSGKVFFQLDSDINDGEIQVLQLEGFEQTIKAPTASEIKQQLDTDGKAVLHINFDTAKATIKPDGQAIVEQINLLLTQNPELKLSIEGHTDNVGNAESNLKLSKDRANTVMFALAGKGIDIARLKAEGFGDTKPMVANDTDENKAKNRRVELVKQ